MKTLWLKHDAIDWNNGVLHIKTPHGNHTVACTENEARGHVKRIIEGVARKYGYGTICLDMTGE
jgi:hypothetical protein